MLEIDLVVEADMIAKSNKRALQLGNADCDSTPAVERGQVVNVVSVTVSLICWRQCLSRRYPRL